MTAAILVINNERISLADEVDMAALIADIMLAIEHGGAFVHIDAGHGAQYDALVNGTTHILVLQRHVSFDARPDDNSWTSSIDLDM